MAPRSYSARPLAAAAAVVLCTHAANANIYDWNWTPGPGSGSLDEGGAIRSINATFDEAGGRLTFRADFSDRRAEGFYLVLTNGQVPVGREGRFGIFFFDAYDVFDGDATTNIKLTSYAYNGGARHHSWRDGSDSLPGDQVPDLIKSALDTSWINSLSAADVTLPGGVQGRTMTFDIYATDLIAHTPLVTGAEPWFGTGFADLLGIKFVPAEVFETDYTPDGRIDWLGTENEGGFQGEFQTLRIPAPGGSLLLATAGSLLILHRARRRA